MIRHVVVLRWNDTVTEHSLAATAAALDALPGAIPEIVEYHHGPDLGLNAGNYDYGIVADFVSAEDHATYRDHPEHQRFIAEHLTGRVADRAALQFEF
jgi:hypothetical protein